MSYDYIEGIREIRSILEKEGFPEYSEQILDSQLSGAFGSEILMIVCSKLLEIKKRDKEVYEVVESESEELIAYANSMGLFPK